MAGKNRIRKGVERVVLFPGRCVCLQSRRRSSRSVHSCARRPLCACPPGFTGRCCESQSSSPTPSLTTLILLSRFSALVKDGSCPILPKIGRFPCVQQCSNDLDCNGDHKCCEQYCSKVCVDVKRKGKVYYHLMHVSF